VGEGSCSAACSTWGDPCSVIGDEEWKTEKPKALLRLFWRNEGGILMDEAGLEAGAEVTGI
jgi:hypothetical protein